MGREDEKQAAMEGLQTKQLTTPGVEGHLSKFGVAAEFATHNHLRSLSAGLKVKVVLAAAMWQNPHVLVIDEPTNYLDRDALGALTEAIEQWTGGVVVISHNLEFCNRVATEKWIMYAGHLRAEGEEYTDTKIEQGNKLDEIQDASGNTIKVKNLKTLTPAETKKEIKLIEKKMKDNKKNNTLSEDEVYELEDRLVQLKASLEQSNFQFCELISSAVADTVLQHLLPASHKQAAKFFCARFVCARVSPWPRAPVFHVHKNSLRWKFFCKLRFEGRLISS